MSRGRRASVPITFPEAVVNMSPVLHTIPETAKRLGVCTATVYNLIASGDLRVVDLAVTGRKTKSRVRDDDLAAFIDKRTRSASSSDSSVT